MKNSLMLMRIHWYYEERFSKIKTAILEEEYVLKID